MEDYLLLSKTQKELKDMCKAHKISGFSNKKKEDLIKLLHINMTGVKHINEDTSSYIPVISLFSGMGGMDLGFARKIIVHVESILSNDFIESDHEITGFVNLKRLPFKIIFQNDILPAAKKIAKLNGWASDDLYLLKDIKEIIADNIKFPYADVIIGGFPCQDFSHAGKRKGLESSRGTLYQSYVNIVTQVKPIIFVAENVHGLLTMPGNPLQIIMDDFAACGYEVKHQLIKCEEFGIPQTRWRVIIMGIRLDCRDKLDNDWNIISENKKTCSIAHYFMHLKEPTESQDHAQQSYSKAAKLAKGQGQTEIRLAGFCPTIRAEHHGNIEFRRTFGGQNNEDHFPERRLTVREAALIQTFPPDCILTDGKPSCMAYKPIGNAVPPLLSYLIARKVHSILDKCRPK